MELAKLQLILDMIGNHRMTSDKKMPYASCHHNDNHFQKTSVIISKASQSLFYQILL